MDVFQQCYIWKHMCGLIILLFLTFYLRLCFLLNEDVHSHFSISYQICFAPLSFIFVCSIPKNIFLEDEISIIFPNYVYNPYYLRHYLFTFFDNFIPSVCIYRFTFSFFVCYNQYSKH